MCEAILQAMQAQGERPTMYGWYHIAWLAATALGSWWLCRALRPGNERQVRRLLLVVSLATMALEVYKQLTLSFTIENGEIRGEYVWYIFPFQFCSTPMYVGLIASLCKQKTVHNACCSYLATYALIAGLSVMLYPEQVFTTHSGINLQSMLCHGSMIVVGVYLLYSGYVCSTRRAFFGAVSVFAAALGIAVLLNEIAYRVGITRTQTFNMFFVSPHCEPTLPVYSAIQRTLAYPWCLLVYFAAFTAGAGLILLAANGSNRWRTTHKTRGKRV